MRRAACSGVISSGIGNGLPAVSGVATKPGQMRRHVDALLPQPGAERIAIDANRGLAGAVDRCRGHAVEASQRAHQGDLAAGLHSGQSGLDRVDDGLQVHGHDLGRIGAAARHPGIGDQQIGYRCGGDPAAQGIAIAEIDRGPGGLGTGSRTLAGDGRQAFGVAATEVEPAAGCRQR